MQSFEILQNIIRNRRSTKPADMNGQLIDNALVHQLLELADWAPTHGKTEPWRFIVYEGAAKKAFFADHAELYKNNTDPEKFMRGKYEKLQQQGDPVSHIIVVYMKRTLQNSIPADEEAAAVAAAIENLLLGASALNIGVLWSTGGMTHHPSMKTYLGLKDEDMVMGILHLGYTDLPLKEGKRNIPLVEKTDWRS
jgi:nitroreductase